MCDFMDVEIETIPIDVIKRNLDIISTRIFDACKKVNRDPKEITFVAVIKNQSNETIKNLFNLGVREFGENRYQQLEAHQKYFETNNIDFNQEITWNFIGQIQSNKITKIANRSQVIQSVDNLNILNVLGKRTDHKKIYIQLAGINDQTRGGVSFENAEELIKSAEKLKIVLSGVMIVPPFEKDPRPYFNKAREFAKKHNLDEISMGKTSDFEIAIECGATTIRVGSAIFKPNNYAL